MKVYLTVFILLIFNAFLNATNINYEVSMSEPHTHYFEVKMIIIDHQKEYIDIQMPVWAPGSYLVREFAKSVDEVSATFNKKKLTVEKINKNTWRIFSDKAKEVVVSYNVYAFEMSVRTSFLDASHGYFNGTSMFMFVDELRNQPSKITIYPYKDWKKVSTALPKTADKGFVYSATNYDILVDAPFEIGNHQTFEFTAAGVLHTVAMYGEGNYNIEQLKTDMAKIVEACTNVFGENPNKNYLFIIHNLTVGSGGLEHLNSTTLQVNRWTYNESGYKGFLSLVAHEYFHLWNVKRVRPKELGPFDYNNENYTSLLWVMEGFTSYYDELLLLRAGFYTEDELLRKFNSSINYVENQPGNKVQSVAHSSFDAWIKSYRPTENSSNTTISYYSKGGIVANMLDLMIINQTKNAKNLDDVMKYLYQEYYKKQNRGFTAKEMQQAIEKVSGLKLDDFFEKYINGTQTFDYETVFAYAGMEVVTLSEKSLSFGASLSGNKVRNIKRNTMAYDGGINVNDEILAINGHRFDDNFAEIIEDKKPGDVLEVLISRDNLIQTLKISIKESEFIRYVLTTPKEKNSIYKKWMKAN
ncbi:MAG: peptidase M61 [Bacteroidetes bacterium HGW-Bacteroidetes-12]|nr:MAG: peptidase M61 [Bacteroidetes bacterium HGW-Bacteroidetes-12]